MKNLIVLCMLLMCPVMAQETEVPAEIQKALSSYQADVTKFNLERDAKVVKSMEKARSALERVQELATRKGNLDLALAAKAELDRLTEEHTQLVFAITPRQPTWVDKTKWQIVWSGSRNFVDFAEDGTMSRGDGAKGTFTVDKDGALAMTWDDGKNWTANQPPKSTPDETAGRNHAGTTFAMTRER